MPQQELLTKLVRFLNAKQIPYLLTGSVASSLHGEPRSTHDVDVVVVLDANSVTQMLEEFHEPKYYLDEEFVRETVEKGGMFNLISDEGDKIDFWMLTADPFDQSRYARRISVDFMGMQLIVSSPEDTILAKLYWSKLTGGSEKHVQDSLRVYEVQYGQLDQEYLRDWARRLSVEELLNKIREEAEPI